MPDHFYQRCIEVGTHQCYNFLMKYAFMILAVFAVWLGTIILAVTNPEIGIFLPVFAIILTVCLFVIGFGKKQ